MAKAVRNYVNVPEHKWTAPGSASPALTALQLCQQYPVDVEREFQRQLERFLGWVTDRKADVGEGCPPFPKPHLYEGGRGMGGSIRAVDALSPV